jgi:hypothetical protein
MVAGWRSGRLERESGGLCSIKEPQCQAHSAECGTLLALSACSDSHEAIHWPHSLLSIDHLQSHERESMSMSSSSSSSTKQAETTVKVSGQQAAREPAAAAPLFC